MVEKMASYLKERDSYTSICFVLTLPFITDKNNCLILKTSLDVLINLTFPFLYKVNFHISVDLCKFTDCQVMLWVPGPLLPCSSGFFRYILLLLKLKRTFLFFSNFMFFRINVLVNQGYINVIRNIKIFETNFTLNKKVLLCNKFYE